MVVLRAGTRRGGLQAMGRTHDDLAALIREVQYVVEQWRNGEHLKAVNQDVLERIEDLNEFQRERGEEWLPHEIERLTRMCEQIMRCDALFRELGDLAPLDLSRPH
jgi:hypothetical protein